MRIANLGYYEQESAIARKQVLNGKTILITGGTGSFGKFFARKVLRDYPSLKRLVIFSRDELKQYEMATENNLANDHRVRFFLGDIRDKNRLVTAMAGIDIVVHAAAMKQVPAAEYNPFEAIKTNVLGAQNIIEACIEQGVKKVIALSTDKAAAPVNLYGATKLCSDKLFTAANRIIGDRNLKLSVVRYGNVMGSRGSVIPLFLKMKSTGILPITDPSMTRFHISLEDGVNMVLWGLKHMRGGEIFIPKIPSYKILDVAEAVCPDCATPVIGIRPGEKIHEEMITSSDSYNCLDLGRYYVILPVTEKIDMVNYASETGGSLVPEGWSYTSGNNPDFLSLEVLRDLIQRFKADSL